jgi:DNA polymerase III delta' subunit
MKEVESAAMAWDLLKQDPSRIPHAILMQGDLGAGASIAHNVAKALLCRTSSKKKCQCNSCHKADEGSHPDLMVLTDEESKLGIAQIRSVIHQVLLRPIESSHKVVIFQEADRMTPDAQNALLKILEEPPKGVYFLLITKDLSGLLPTVISRCQRLVLGLSETSIVSPQEREEIQSRLIQLLEDAQTTHAALLPDWTSTKKDEALIEIDELVLIFRDLLVIKTEPSQTASLKLFHPRRSKEMARLAQNYSWDQIEEALWACGKASDDIDHSANVRAVGLNLWKKMGLSLV